MLSFFLTNSMGVLQRELDRHIMPVLVFSSRNSYKVFNSRANREYMGPRGGIFLLSICMTRSYG